MNVIAANNLVKHESVNAAEAIQFAVAGCDVGKVLVARSRTGVCAILLGTNAEELEIELGKIFPDDVFIRNERAVKEDMFKILRFLSSPNAGLDIALDIRGTFFQRKVWEALRTIPAGRPLTFAQLACRIPGSKSLRAIGQACAPRRLMRRPATREAAFCLSRIRKQTSDRYGRGRALCGIEPSELTRCCDERLY